MSRTSLLFGFSALVLAAMLAAMTTSTAQLTQPAHQPAADQADQAQANERTSEATEREVRRANADNATRRMQRNNRQAAGHIVRASDVIGHEIVNSQEESVGEINDLVIDPNSGKIRYAAVTYGGFAGLGDKMFAVPWEAFECRPEADDPAEYIVVLDVQQESLENAQGFDQENWPNFADKNFTDKVDQQYGVQRNQRNQRTMVDENSDDGNNARQNQRRQQLREGLEQRREFRNNSNPNN